MGLPRAAVINVRVGTPPFQKPLAVAGQPPLDCPDGFAIKHAEDLLGFAVKKEKRRDGLFDAVEQFSLDGRGR